MQACPLTVHSGELAKIREANFTSRFGGKFHRFNPRTSYVSPRRENQDARRSETFTMNLAVEGPPLPLILQRAHGANVAPVPQ